MHYNKQEMGPAAPAVMNATEERPSFKKSLKRQLGSDTVRNATVENPFVATDFHKQGYRALPNEREVTGLRTYDSNIKAEYFMWRCFPVKSTVHTCSHHSTKWGQIALSISGCQ